MPNPLYQTRRNASTQAGLITLLLFVGVIAIAWLLLWPGYKGLTEEKDRQVSVESQHETKLQTTRDIDQLVGNYKAKKTDLAILQQGLPPSPMVPQLLANVESLVLQSGMSVEAVKITEQKKDQSTQVGASSMQAVAATSTSETFITPHETVVLNIDLSVTGSFDKFPVLLDLLEKNLRLFDIKSVSTESAEIKGSKSTTFVLLIDTFYQK